MQRDGDEMSTMQNACEVSFGCTIQHTSTNFQMFQLNETKVFGAEFLYARFTTLCNILKYTCKQCS